MSLSLMDFRDLDLMLALHAEGASGVSTAELAEALGMKGQEHNVGARCAWMRRFGIFQFDEKRKLWTLSDGGERVILAKRRAANGQVVDKVPDEAMVDVMSHVTARYRQGDPMLATMLRREFMFGTSPRSKVWGG